MLFAWMCAVTFWTFRESFHEIAQDARIKALESQFVDGRTVVFSNGMWFFMDNTTNLWLERKP